MRLLSVIIIVLSLVTSSFAGGFAKYAGEFLTVGGGSRSFAMGGAYVAVANDVTAGFWNPAGLVNAEGLQFHFTHTRQFISSIQHDYISVSNKFDNETTLGISMLRLGTSDIPNVPASAGIFNAQGELIDIEDSKITYFNTADYAFLFSYAKNYTQNISVGANAKIIYRNFSSESAYGIGFDAGLQYNWYPDLTVGLMLRDITTTMMAWSTGEKEYITPSIRGGVSYKYVLEDWDLFFRPSMDLGVLLESRESAAQFNVGPISFDSFWGFETGYANTIFLRLGYDDLERFNGGLGLEITKFGVDYSYTNFDTELGNVHRISFHLKLDAI